MNCLGFLTFISSHSIGVAASILVGLCFAIIISAMRNGFIIGNQNKK